MNRTERTIAIFAILCLVAFIIGFSYLLFFSGKSVMSIQKLGIFVPADEKAWQRVKVAYEMDDRKKTMGYVGDFLVEFPNSKLRNKVLLTAATVFFDRKDYANARKYALNVIDTLNRDDKKSELNDTIDAIILLGKVSKENGFYEPTVVNFLEDVYVKADEKKRSEIAVYLGYANLYQKNHTNALRYFNSVNGEYSIIGRARVYIDQNKYPEAIQEYLNYFTSYPNSERYGNVKTAFVKQTLFYADQLKRAKEYDQAVRFLLNVANYFPRDNSADEALVSIAQIYQVNRNYAGALSYLNKALNNSVTGGDDMALYVKGTVYYDQGKTGESARVFQDLMDKHPKSLYYQRSREWKALIAQEAQTE